MRPEEIEVVYDPGRDAVVTNLLSEDFKGVVVSDRYAPYNWIDPPSGQAVDVEAIGRNHGVRAPGRCPGHGVRGPPVPDPARLTRTGAGATIRFNARPRRRSIGGEAPSPPRWAQGTSPLDDARPPVLDAESS